MRLLLTVVALCGLLGIQAADVIPKNKDNINACLDSCRPHDCSDVSSQGATADGVYLIYPGDGSSNPVPVYCDMTSDGGPWTVFQKRFDGGVDFYRGWEDYRSGFGRASGEYWLGLQNIFLLTLKRTYKLRIVLKDFDNDTRHVTYDYFSLSPLAVNPDEDGYTLHVDGFKEGDPERPAGGRLNFHKRMKFSTYDRDRDTYAGNCAKEYHGAFWFSSCHSVNLNGEYKRGKTTEYATGILWNSWKGNYYSLKGTEMKIASAEE